ncbi:MAG: formylglycine-generating enzyme family protein [Rhodocyclaceae bacterium]|nr:formylglycine-generating enzyme family protein [Rhodocyclaceae bacterium]MBX3667877.1 formylglycine-generating enzyme family protein [Rhodocyclaceae bacterium]
MDPSKAKPQPNPDAFALDTAGGVMGSPDNEPERHADIELHHPVELTRGFWLADTACIQALWRAVLDESPSRFEGDDLPVEQVSWDDICGRFLPTLNQQVPGLVATLPTEAQWENACRAGTLTPFWFGDDIAPDLVNYNGKYPYAGGKSASSAHVRLPSRRCPATAGACIRCTATSGSGVGIATASMKAARPSISWGRLRAAAVCCAAGAGATTPGGCRCAYRLDVEPADREHCLGFRLARGFSPRQVRAGVAAGVRASAAAPARFVAGPQWIQSEAVPD